MRETEEHIYPAAEFHIGGLTILASQTIEADSLRLDDPADTWEVKGTDDERVAPQLKREPLGG